MANETPLKSTDVFSQEFLDEMKATLEATKTKVLKELTGIQNEAVDMGSEVDDDVHEIEQLAVNKTLKETLEKELRDIDKALERIAGNTYGICKFTHEPISEARLRARPTASSSVEAKKFLTNEA
jgi:DnaK suppressor protein